jgi:hypothetical protein
LYAHLILPAAASALGRRLYFCPPTSLLTCPSFYDMLFVIHNGKKRMETESKNDKKTKW